MKWLTKHLETVWKSLQTDVWYKPSSVGFLILPWYKRMGEQEKTIFIKSYFNSLNNIFNKYWIKGTLIRVSILRHFNIFNKYVYNICRLIINTIRKRGFNVRDMIWYGMAPKIHHSLFYLVKNRPKHWYLIFELSL